jgi:CubicO group peptidase (beta-lactamase class C family)
MWASGLDDIRQDLVRIQKEHGAGAVAVVIVDRRQVLLEHYRGVTDWDEPREINRSTWFRAGSVTKVFTGLALLRAEEEGLLKLDQPVVGQLPDMDLAWAFDNPFRASSTLVPADLMEHTAGWHDMSQIEFDDSNPAPLTLAQALQLRPASRISRWAPGTYYSYSNSGPGLAAYIVEQASGQVFDEWIREQVFEPLGMSATLLYEQHVANGLATGYDSDYRTEIPYWHIVFRPSGGMNLRPIEISRFLQMMLNEGVLDGRRIFSKEQLHRLRTPTRTHAARAGLEYGYGLGIYSAVRDGHVVYMHGGDADGYLTHFAYSLKSGLAYFVVINAFNHAPLNAMKERLTSHLIKDLPIETPPSTVSIPAATAERLTGHYRKATDRFPHPGQDERKLSVRISDEGLAVSKVPRKWLDLTAVAVNTDSVLLRRKSDPVATRAFILLDNGTVVYQDSSSNWVKEG